MQAGAVGPRLLNADGTLQRSAWPFPAVWRIWLEALMLHRPLRRIGLLEDLGTWNHDQERTVDFLIGEWKGGEFATGHQRRTETRALFVARVAEAIRVPA